MAPISISQAALTMVCELPEQLLEQAEFLLTLEPNQANLAGPI